MRVNRFIFLPFTIRAKTSLPCSSRNHSRLPIHTVVLALCSLSMPLLFPLPSFAQEKKGGSGSQEHNIKSEDCPPGTKGPFSSCAEYWEAINKEALRLGYEDKGGNGIADFLETYHTESGFGANRSNNHDCADVAAEVACVSNQSECIEQVAKQYRSNSANHSDNYVEGIGECDFTPMRSGGGYVPNKGQAGGGLADNYDTTIDDGAPDPGEIVDPAYTCAMNGANRRSVGSGLGGAAGSAAMMGALSQLMNGMNGGMSSTGQNTGDSGSDQSSSSGSEQKTLPTPLPTPRGTVPTGTPTPACTPTPEGTPASRTTSRTPTSDDSQDEDNSIDSKPRTVPAAKAIVPPLDSGFFSESNTPRKKSNSNQALNDFNRGMFDPRDIE